MGDYYTQWLLKPWHKFFMNKLKAIPEDCTYNQHKHVEQIKLMTQKGTFFGHDLKQATDRFPIKLMMKEIEQLTSKALASG